MIWNIMFLDCDCSLLIMANYSALRFVYSGNLKPVWHWGWSFWSPFYEQFLLTTARSFIFRVEPNISGTEFKHIKSRFYCQSFQSMSFVLLDSCRPKNMITKLPLPKWTPSSPLLSFPSRCSPTLRSRLQEVLNPHTLTFNARTPRGLYISTA